MTDGRARTRRLRFRVPRLAPPRPGLGEELAMLVRARSLTELRYHVELHRRGLAALAAAALVLLVLPGSRPRPGPLAPVVVAAHALAAGTVLAPGDLRLAELPPAAVPAAAVRAVAEATGQVLAGPVTAGEPLTAARLLVPAGWPRGEVAVPVRFPDAGAAALARTGERVTVVSGGAGGPATVLAAAAPVLATGAGGLVVLAVPPAAALAIAGAAADRLALFVVAG